MKKIIELANRLQNLRKNINDLKEKVDILKIEKDDVQAELIEAMKGAELKSIKTNTHNYARTVKRDVRVIDEQIVIAELRKRKMAGKLTSVKLDTIPFKAYAKELLENTGEVIEGSEPTETEYMSIKTLKPTR